MVRAQRPDFVVPRVGDLPESATIGVSRRAAELRRRGVDVVDFGAGDPDFDTPAHIRRAAADALERGLTHYGPGRGLLELREAIARQLERLHGLIYDPETQIIVTPGAKQALLEAVLTVVGPEDEVIVFEPTWPSYEAIVRLAGGVPVTVQLLDDFSIEPADLEDSITPHTRALVLGSPGNPTGRVATAGELELIARLCREHDLLLLSDEIYDRILAPGVRAVSPATLPGMQERTVVVNGFSKTYAMTGWRLGYAAGPPGLIRQMLKVQEHSVTMPTSFVQAGGIAALEGPQDALEAMVQEYDRRRVLVVDALNAMPGVTCRQPEGAFYAFPDVRGTGMSGTELAQALLDQGVAVTPGRGFGPEWDTHIRLSFTTSAERLQTGLERMAAALRPG